MTGNNPFAYCGNNPANRSDRSGNAWETVFDVISLGASIVDVAMNPSDPWAWVGLAGDVIDVAIPFVAGVGETVRAVNAGRKITDVADDLHDAKKAAKSIHANSLDFSGTNYGYVLSDKTTGEVVKFGESIDPAHRYTKKYLNGDNPINKPLDMSVVISGTKQDIHIWQHEQIVDFRNVVGKLPALNNSLW